MIVFERLLWGVLEESSVAVRVKSMVTLPAGDKVGAAMVAVVIKLNVFPKVNTGVNDTVIVGFIERVEVESGVRDIGDGECTFVQDFVNVATREDDTLGDGVGDLVSNEDCVG